MAHSMGKAAAQQSGGQAEPKRGRPNMPHYGISKRSEGLLAWSWVEEQMGKSRNYWICSTRPVGRPHAVPVWGVWLEGNLYFGSDRQARKARNLAANPEVVVHLESGDDTVIFEGTVEEVTDKPILARMASATAAKYPPFTPDPEPPPGQITYVLRPRVAFAWREKDFPTSATRWVFNDAKK
jgi:hypothetical protein